MRSNFLFRIMMIQVIFDDDNYPSEWVNIEAPVGDVGRRAKKFCTNVY